jgi:hypothetical protein
MLLSVQTELTQRETDADGLPVRNAIRALHHTTPVLRVPLKIHNHNLSRRTVGRSRHRHLSNDHCSGRRTRPAGVVDSPVSSKNRIILFSDVSASARCAVHAVKSMSVTEIGVLPSVLPSDSHESCPRADTASTNTVAMPPTSTPPSAVATWYAARSTKLSPDCPKILCALYPLNPDVSETRIRLDLGGSYVVVVAASTTAVYTAVVHDL